jgi:hypothetical protein
MHPEDENRAAASKRPQWTGDVDVRLEAESRFSQDGLDVPLRDGMSRSIGFGAWRNLGPR